MRLLALIGKELRTFERDFALVFLVVFVFLIHPYQSATELPSGLNDHPAAVYDLDRTQASARFVEMLRPPYFSVKRYLGTDAEVAAVLDRDEASTVIVVPEGFERRLHRGEAAPVQVIGDGTFSVDSQRANAYIAAMALDFSEAQQHSPARDAGLPIVDARLRVRYNAPLREDWSNALDMLLMGVALIPMLLPAALMVREKEQGTIEQLLVSPLRPWEITMAKILPMVLVVTVATLGSLGVLVRALDLPVRGSLPLFILATVLTVFSMGGISLVIATVTRTVPSALLVAVMLIIPIAFLSGNYVPLEAMPAWQYYLTLLSPQRYYLSIGRAILFKGASLAVLWKDFAGLVLVGSGLFAVGVRRFQRQFG